MEYDPCRGRKPIPRDWVLIPVTLDVSFLAAQGITPRYWPESLPRASALVVLYKWLNARIAIAVSAYQTKRYVEIIYRRSTLATLYPTTGYDLYRTTRAPALGYARPPLRGYQDSRLTGFEPPDGGVRT